MSILTNLTSTHYDHSLGKGLLFFICVHNTLNSQYFLETNQEAIIV